MPDGIRVPMANNRLHSLVLDIEIGIAEQAAEEFHVWFALHPTYGVDGGLPDELARILQLFL